MYIHIYRVTNNSSPKRYFSALPGKYFVQDVLKLAGSFILIIPCSDMFYEKNPGNSMYVSSSCQQSERTKDSTCSLKNLRNAEPNDTPSPITYTFCAEQRILETARTSKYWHVMPFLTDLRKVFCNSFMQKGNE